MDFAKIFRSFVTFQTALSHYKKYEIYFRSRLLPFDEFYGLWFPDKDSDSAKARESNWMNLNGREIVIVHIGFVFWLCPFLRVRIGVENQAYKLFNFWTLFQSWRVVRKHFSKQYATKCVQFWTILLLISIRRVL